MKHIILNPVSAGGRTDTRKEKIIREFNSQFGNSFNLTETSYKSEATEITRKAIDNGCEQIIAVGGDGTINEVINGFMNEGKIINPNCKLGIISSGTGQGFAQSIGLPKKIAEQVQVIKEGNTNFVDIGKIIIYENCSSNKVKYFVNEFQIGIGGAVVSRVQKETKKLGGLLAYGIITARMAYNYCGHQISVFLNGDQNLTKKYLGIVVSNGAYTAGGMQLTPNARLDDGYFDILLIHDQTKTNRIKNFSKIYSGAHLNSGNFSHYRVSKMNIDSKEVVPIEAFCQLPFLFIQKE
jgi:YegS/Rv2252/BmrU family lipid kinase